MKTITLSNQKGGVAKTSTCWAIACGLHKKGYRVLLVDLDPQTNLSFTAGVNLLEIETTLYDVFRNKKNVEDAIINLKPGMDILTGGISLASADRDFTQLGREKMLKKALSKVEKNYDFAIIDTAPSLGVMNENSMTASDYIIIPIQADIFGLQGIYQLYGFIEDIKENSNPELNVLGILITRVTERTSIYKDMREQFENVSEKMGTKLFDNVIHNSVVMSEVALSRGNLFDDYQGKKVTDDYNAFIEEMLARIDKL